MKLLKIILLFVLCSNSYAYQAEALELLVGHVKKEEIKFEPKKDVFLKMHSSMIYPVVRVSYGKNGEHGGTGTIIYSDNRSDPNFFETFILTNYHVIEHVIKITSDSETINESENTEIVNIEIFEYDNISYINNIISLQADVVLYSKEYDLAILKLKYDKKIKHIAEMLPLDKIKEVFIFDTVIVVGCKLSHPPLISIGNITSLNIIIDKKTHWLTDANIFYGSSGGAAFVNFDRKWLLIGVPTRIAISTMGIVTHMCYFIPVSSVYEWFNGENMTFFYDKNHTPKECFEKRESELKKGNE